MQLTGQLPLILFLAINNGVSQGELDRVFIHCCNLGRNYGRTSTNCGDYPLPVSGVKVADQVSCTISLDVCCREEVILGRCDDGKTAAQQNQDCDGDNANLGGDEYKQCCDCCQLGLLAGSSGYGKQCDSAGFQIIKCNRLYKECCEFSKLRQGFINNRTGGLAESDQEIDNHIDADFNPGPVLRLTTLPSVLLTESSPTTPCPDSGPDGSGGPCIKFDPVPLLPPTATDSGTDETACLPGYDFHAGIGQCLDINECNRRLHSCQRAQKCVNTVGSYKCEVPLGEVDAREPARQPSCPGGYQTNPRTGQCEDIDECGSGNDNCGVGMRCENEVGTFRCIREQSCGTGYTYNADRRECIDNDECVLGNHNCGKTAYECVNTQGSFRCTLKECPKRMRLDYETGHCNAVTCTVGYEASDDGNCVDINECESPSTCRRNQDCLNTVGSFMCRDKQNCGEGYLMNEDGSRCDDVDECAEGTHTCVGNQICENKPGTHFCNCQEGFEFDVLEKLCKDIDECKRFGLSACASSAECQNFAGSFRCNCKDGFRQEVEGKNCQDIDECKEYNPCQHSCINNWGGYNCTCNSGYRLGPDKRSCEDLDECKETVGHQLCFGECINVPGSYNCTCPSGFRMLPDGHSCQDIDECKEQQYCSRSDQICVNTEGGYQCHTIRCPHGYIQDQEQKNRCRRKSLVCPMGDMGCLHQPVSYSYNFMGLPSNPTFPLSGKIDLFTMRGPQQPTTNVEFNLIMKNARPAVVGVVPADRRFFDVRTTGFNQATIALVRPLDGPQEVELEMLMSMITNRVFSGKAVANIIITVTKVRPDAT